MGGYISGGEMFSVGATICFVILFLFRAAVIVVILIAVAGVTPYDDLGDFFVASIDPSHFDDAFNFEKEVGMGERRFNGDPRGVISFFEKFLIDLVHLVEIRNSH